jgi:CheY-like chemotaxis protein
MSKNPGKLILVTDDDPIIAEIIVKMLNKIGFRTLEASNGADCIDTARKNRPDLLFLDILMEPMNGWEVASIMKNDRDLKDVPIVMVTGKELTLEDIMNRAYLIENYIKKSSVTMDVLRESIEDVLAAKTQGERILGMAGKSGVQKEMLNELKDRYMRKFNQYRNIKKLYNLYSQLYSDNNVEQKTVLLSCLKKGLEQQAEDLAKIEKMLVPPESGKGRKKKSAA